MRYFHINNETHIVTNICLWDGVSEYNPPGVYLIAADDFPEVTYGWKKQNLDGKHLRNKNKNKFNLERIITKWQ